MLVLPQRFLIIFVLILFGGSIDYLDRFLIENRFCSHN